MKFRCDHRSPTTRRNNTTNVPTIINRRREAQAWTDEPSRILIYKGLILDFSIRSLHESNLLSPLEGYTERAMKQERFSLTDSLQLSRVSVPIHVEYSYYA